MSWQSCIDRDRGLGVLPQKIFAIIGTNSAILDNSTEFIGLYGEPQWYAIFDSDKMWKLSIDTCGYTYCYVIKEGYMKNYSLVLS